MAQQLPVAFEFRANQTFDDFYPGTNQEILAQLKKTISGTGEQLIFLWGDAGHGKSHLLQACCSLAFSQNKGSFYLDFTDTTLKPELLDGLESLEVVCLDNVDTIAGQEVWEKALFNFFNQHRANKYRLILSSASAPNSLPFKLPDLLTRLNWGLSLRIQPLDDTDKCAALIHKAQQMGLEIAPQAAQFLLTRYDRGLPALWQMLDKLDSASLAAKRKLTIPFLKEVLERTD